MIKKIESEFIGIGEVKGFKFKRIAFADNAYCYQVCSSNKKYHYEVFMRLNTPVAIDFKNKIFSDTDFKEYYPKSKQFGVNAWTFTNINEALEKLVDIGINIQVEN